MNMKWSTVLINLWLFLILLHFNIPGKIEGRFFPVISNFEITSIEASKQYENSFRIFGEVDKIRGCSYKGITADLNSSTGEGKMNTSVSVNLEELSIIRGIGHHKFGPWRINVNAEQLDHVVFTYTHECNSLWKTETVINASYHPDAEEKIEDVLIGDELGD